MLRPFSYNPNLTEGMPTLNLSLDDAPGVLTDDADNGTSSLAQPHYYDSLYRAVAVTLSSLVFTVGFVGNILVVVVIARTRSMHTTTNCYILSLAVADCLVLMSATLPAVPETFYRIDEWPFGRALCSLLVYLQYVGVDASSLSIAAFTIERYIAICHPIRAQTMCTVSRAKKITGGLWLFTVLYCGPWLGLTDLNVSLLSDGTSITKCTFRLQRSSYLTLYMFDLVVFYILPFVISTVLYCLIGRILVLTSFRHAQDRPTRTSHDRRSTDKNRASTSPRRASDSRAQVIRMLVVVVVVFATLWMPYRVMVVYNSFAQHKVIDLWFLMFSRTLIYINCAINPILYNLMSVKFRRAFKNLLCCGLRPTGTPAYLYSEMWTEGTNVKRHTFSPRRPPFPTAKATTPFACRELRSCTTNDPQLQHHLQAGSRSDERRGDHTLKVILLEWVKGSDKVKVQTTRHHPCYGSNHSQNAADWPGTRTKEDSSEGGLEGGGGKPKEEERVEGGGEPPMGDRRSIVGADRSPSLSEKKENEGHDVSEDEPLPSHVQHSVNSCSRKVNDIAESSC